VAEKHDYYDVLGVGRSATKDELKRAYRRKARLYHPDVNNDDGAGELFKEVSEAYEVLSKDETRASYDRFGHAGVNGSAGARAAGFGGMTDIFEEFFGFGDQRRRRGPRQGNDLRYDLKIEFDEAVFGAERDIEITRPEVCSTCKGSGAEPGTSPIRCANCNGQGEVRESRQSFFGSFVNVATCPVCQGSGETVSTACHACAGRKQTQQKRILKVKIPPGVDSETQIRLAGEGAAGSGGGPPGHLFVVIHASKHEIFERRGDDIIMELNINVAQAALGDRITVPTVDGETEIAIPSGTQSGKVFRLSGRGVPHLQRSGRGDQLVVIQVSIPKNLDEKQRDLFRELSGTLGKEVISQQGKSFLGQLKDTLGDVFGF